KVSSTMSRIGALSPIGASSNALWVKGISVACHGTGKATSPPISLPISLPTAPHVYQSAHHGFWVFGHPSHGRRVA
ncbi:MAG: hypothetical protein VXW73_03930, partial [Actinomycetota bacterium]|nr:hypothetical protein [Actinomycetota bacterium]